MREKSRQLRSFSKCRQNHKNHQNLIIGTKTRRKVNFFTKTVKTQCVSMKCQEIEKYQQKVEKCQNVEK